MHGATAEWHGMGTSVTFASAVSRVLAVPPQDLPYFNFLNYILQFTFPFIKIFLLSFACGPLTGLRPPRNCGCCGALDTGLTFALKLQVKIAKIINNFPRILQKKPLRVLPITFRLRGLTALPRHASWLTAPLEEHYSTFGYSVLRLLPQILSTLFLAQIS